MDGDDKKLTLYFPEREHRALKEEAARRGMTMSDIVREALKMRLHIIEHRPASGQPTDPV